jgi:hypothetical protein
MRFPGSGDDADAHNEEHADKTISGQHTLNTDLKHIYLRVASMAVFR